MPTDLLFGKTLEGVNTQPGDSTQESTGTDNTLGIETTPPTQLGGDQTQPAAGPAAERIVIDSPGSVSEILAARALSANKPEILTLAHFLPATSKKGRTASGRMLDLQYDARSLMVDDVSTIIAELEEDPVVKTQFASLISNYEELIEIIEDQLQVLSDSLSTLGDVKEALDLKDNPLIQDEVSNIRVARGSATENGVLTTPPAGLVSSFRDNIVCHLLFSDDAYSSMSNTKVLGQIISDLRNTIISNSPRLFNEYISARTDDRDPISISTSREIVDDFTFTPGLIASEKNTSLSVSIPNATDFTTDSGLFDPNVLANFTTFLDSLPILEKDRIKLLTTLISKELRMSGGVSRMMGTTYDDRFTVENTGGLIARVLGSVGGSILGDNPTGGTYSSLLRFANEEGEIVLPFETREVIDKSENRTYIPGSVFLVDAIMRSDDRPNTEPLKEFSDNVSDIIDNNTATLGYLLNFDDPTERLHNIDVINGIYGIVGEIVGKAKNSNNISESAALTLALLRASQTDSMLRFFLYRYTREIRSGRITTATVTDASDDNTGGEDTGGSGTQIDPPGGTNGGPTILGIDDLQSELGNIVETDSLTDGFGNGGTGRSGNNPTRKGSMGVLPNTSIVTGGTSVENIEQTVDGVIEGTISGQTLLPQEIEKIIAATYKVSSNSASRLLSGRTYLSINEGDIEAILNDGIDDLDSIFKRIADFADSLEAAAAGLCGTGPSNVCPPSAHRNDKGYTRFNRFSDDTVLMIVFEIIASMVSEFVEVDFYESAATGSTYSLGILTAQNDSIKQKIDLITGQETTATISSAYKTLTSLLDSIHKAVVMEDSIMRDLVDIIKAAGSIFTQKAESAINFFDLSSTDPAAVALKEIIDDEDNEDILKNLTNQQIALGWQGTRTLLTSPDVSLLPSNQIITETQKLGLESLLNEPEFAVGQGQNLKLLTVGMPAGTLNALQNPVFTVGQDTSLESETADIVTIKVFRRDPEFSELIFKPQNFLFDMSRFASEKEVLTSPPPFTRLVDSGMELIDISGTAGIGRRQTLSALKSDAEYDLLTDLEKEEVFVNHVRSHLLKRYIKLLTGIDFLEHTFIANENLILGSPLEPEVRDLLSAISNSEYKCVEKTASQNPEVLGALAGGASMSATLTQDFSKVGSSNTIESATSGLLSAEISCDDNSSSTTDDDATDSSVTTTEGEASESDDTAAESTRQFKRILNSLVFRSSEHKIRVEQPKLFERIFVVPVDPDDFVIDEEATRKSKSGRQMLNSLTYQSCVIDVQDDDGNPIKKLEPRHKSEGAYEFSELFAVVSLGVDT